MSAAEAAGGDVSGTSAGGRFTRLAEGDDDMAEVETGKRYRCPDCAAEFIVTRGGSGTLRCGDTELERI